MNEWTTREAYILSFVNKPVLMTEDLCLADGHEHCVTITDGYTAGQRWVKRCIKCGKTFE